MRNQNFIASLWQKALTSGVAPGPLFREHGIAPERAQRVITGECTLNEEELYRVDGLAKFLSKRKPI